MTSDAIEDLIDAGRLERVEAGTASAHELLDEARLHLESATALVESDPNGSYALLYNGARKATTGHMLASGLRPRNRPGSQEAVCLYAEAILTGGVGADHVIELDRMRRDRNRSEYWGRVFGRAEIEADLEHARGIVAGLEKAWPE